MLHHFLVRIVPARFHWPPSLAVIALVAAIGVALLMIAILVKRKSASSAAAVIVLGVATLWNAAIVYAFMSPYNRHVFHLTTHRISVIVNAAIGVIWCSLCVLSLVRWFRSETV